MEMTKVDIKIGGIDLFWGSHSVKRKDETHRVMKVKEWLKNNKKDNHNKMINSKQIINFLLDFMLVINNPKIPNHSMNKDKGNRN